MYMICYILLQSSFKCEMCERKSTLNRLNCEILTFLKLFLQCQLNVIFIFQSFTSRLIFLCKVQQ